MAADSSKPSVLIFGGLNTCSRALASFLVPLHSDPLVSYLRIVDKYSVHPPTTLEIPIVEYRQANLTVPAAIQAAFDPPEGNTAFDYVFDFTGEVRNDRSETIQINTTFAVSRLLALEASKRQVKSYVRIQQPFYETSAKNAASEKDDIKPVEAMGIWWHETLRMLASIEGLNLVILRIGFVYGPYTDFGNVISAITVASVYGYMQKPMKSMWSPGKNPTNTIHVEDVAGGAWACANWVANHGRKKADELAGVPIPFHNDKTKVKEVEGMLPHDEKPVAPIFNLVDDSNSTLVSTGQIVSSFFGTTFEFFNLIESTVFKLLDDLEDINEHHVEGWTEMLSKSVPPITNTPISAYMDKYTLEKHVVGFDNSKIKQIVGYKLLRPDFNHANIKEVVDKWKAEGAWPNIPST
ncbi:hypothetical protein M413DRAFT_438490 [Hebeloma cylindrosporum]|uniref:NAD-dependent epimerase/dehydratase domain-containing protein n=1 Tax=Hebeloma cylindrosporum TaxID=76867 RepID=A0A0C3CKU0_HEBCY|nr:hypothetical protein M413DRAFT_438490 [Hebeloma cylindrosporum h7]